MKMTLLGSGVRAPFVLKGLAGAQDDLDLDEVVLHDLDGERLELMTALGASFCREWGARFTVRGEPDPRTAIEGSRFVFSAIRPGQERARAVDEEVPLKHGVLGQETTGPGGFAKALRTEFGGWPWPSGSSTTRWASRPWPTRTRPSKAFASGSISGPQQPLFPFRSAMSAHSVQFRSVG